MKNKLFFFRFLTLILLIPYLSYSQTTPTKIETKKWLSQKFSLYIYGELDEGNSNPSENFMIKRSDSIMFSYKSWDDVDGKTYTTYCDFIWSTITKFQFTFTDGKEGGDVIIIYYTLAGQSRKSILKINLDAEPNLKDRLTFALNALVQYNFPKGREAY